MQRVRRTTTEALTKRKRVQSLHWQRGGDIDKNALLAAYAATLAIVTARDEMIATPQRRVRPGSHPAYDGANFQLVAWSQ